MHEELFEKLNIVARYRAGPDVEARERFLRQASAEGHSRSTLKRIAWAPLFVAAAVRPRGSISSTQLRSLLCRRIRLRNGRRPSEYTARLFRRFGEHWLRSIGALLPDNDQPPRFARELGAFTEYMRVERGLSPVTIATREERMHLFFASLPSRVRSLGDVTISQIDAYLEGEAQRGWRRSSLHALGSSLRCFFRYAAQQGWCVASLALGIDLPRRYALGDVPRVPSIDEVNQLLEATATGNDPVTIRDHAVLSLLIHYGMEEPGVAEISAPHAGCRRADRGRVSGRYQYAPRAPRTSQRIWWRGRQGHSEPGVAQGDGRLERVEFQLAGRRADRSADS